MRESGILMPIFSLPSKYGIGCFSKQAYEFVDFLRESGQKKWQILPLGPTGYGDSPYQSFSTFAGNPYFIDVETLVEEGLLTESECRDENNYPIRVAGCPPDAFSATGQLWGNPLFDWEYHKATGYKWWLSRIAHCFRLYDVVRIDHFRGFVPNSKGEAGRSENYCRGIICLTHTPPIVWSTPAPMTIPPPGAGTMKLILKAELLPENICRFRRWMRIHSAGIS